MANRFFEHAKLIINVGLIIYKIKHRRLRDLLQLDDQCVRYKTRQSASASERQRLFHRLQHRRNRRQLLFLRLLRLYAPLRPSEGET